MSRYRLAIVVSHPIQYQVPLFRRLAASKVVDPVILFLSHHGVEPSFDAGFGRVVRFDVPLVEGFDHEFIPNRSPRPGLDRPWGLVNPGVPRALAQHGCDAVMLHGWQYASMWLAVAAARARGIPYLLRGEARHDTESSMSASKKRIKHALLGPVVRGAGACLAIGERNRDFYVAYGASRKRVVPAPYSIDNDRFASEGTRARASRADRLRSVGLDPNLPLVLFAAKLQPWKRPLDVIGAVARMCREANLVMVGDGELRPAVEAAIAELPHSVCLGFVNQTEMPLWYGSADLYVLPSSVEPWGLAVNEAMAAGAVPVVSEMVGCAPDLVTQDTGRVFRVGDVAALAQTMDGLLADLAKLDEMRHSGAERIEQYSIEKTATGIELGTEVAVSARRRMRHQ